MHLFTWKKHVVFQVGVFQAYFSLAERLRPSHIINSFSVVKFGMMLFLIKTKKKHNHSCAEGDQPEF